ncbi:MAG TPA: response regulator [Ktedonobacteraceae bacterium]
MIQEESLRQAPGAARKTLLIVEDDLAHGELLSQAITQETPYFPMVVETGARALEVVEHVKPDLLILDYYLTDMNGLQLYDQLHAKPGLEAVPALLLSASLERHQREIEQRHILSLAKPFDLDELFAMLQQVFA